MRTGKETIRFIHVGLFDLQKKDGPEKIQWYKIRISHYTEQISWGFFFFGKTRRCDKSKTIYYLMDDCMYDRQKEKLEKVVIKFNSLWEFYKYINYDYKKQKWTDS